MTNYIPQGRALRAKPDHLEFDVETKNITVQPAREYIVAATDAREQEEVEVEDATGRNLRPIIPKDE